MLIKRLIRDYFTFNTRERNGFLTLTALLLILCGIHLWIHISPSPHQPLTDAQIAALDELARKSVLDELPTSMVKSDFDSSDARQTVVEHQHLPVWKPFDPNTISQVDLEKTGLEHFLAKRIINYRNKGGQFYKPEDVARIYDMDTNWLKEADPYLVFPERELSSWKNDIAKKDTSEWKTAPKPLIDINRADSGELVTIAGVGPFYASEIVELRGQLGGFFDLNQLNDVYRMRPETIEKIAAAVFIDSTAVKHIHVNSASVEELADHAYLDWKTAKIIVAYRKAHGPYLQSADILQTDVVSQDVYLKIAPYLSFE